MPIIRVPDPGDPRLSDYRDLGVPERLRMRGLFVAEGRLVVRRLIDGGRFRIRSLMVSQAALAALAPPDRQLESTDPGDQLPLVDPEVPVYVCPPAWFASITGYNIHRGCLALAERPAQAPWDALVRDARSIVVLDGVANADNVGGLFRSAAAFGVDGVLLSPSAGDPLYRKAVRTSMGAALQVRFAIDHRWPESLDGLKALGFIVLALTPRHPSVPLRVWASSGVPLRWALVVGAEGAGVSPPVELLAHERVRIPIASGVDSLNASVAAGIALSVLVDGGVRSAPWPADDHRDA